MKLNIVKDNKIMTKSFVGTDVGVLMQIKITINIMYQAFVAAKPLLSLGCALHSLLSPCLATIFAIKALRYGQTDGLTDTHNY